MSIDKSKILEQIPELDNDLLMRKLGEVKRETGVKWESLVSSYQDKLKLFSMLQSIELKGQTDMTELYNQHSKDANERFLIDRKIREQERLIEKLKEEIEEEKRALNEITVQLDKGKVTYKEDSRLVLCAHSENVLLQLIEFKNELYITTQQFEPQSYRSNYWPIENYQGINYLAALAVSNFVNDRCMLAYTAEFTLKLVEFTNLKNSITKRELLSLKLENQPTWLFVLDDGAVLAIMSSLGRVTMVDAKEKREVEVHKGSLIKEAKMFDRSLYLMESERILILKREEGQDKNCSFAVQEVRTSDYTNLTFYLKQRPNFNIEYLRFPELVGETLVYVDSNNTIKVYNLASRQAMKIELPILMDVEYFAYLKGCETLVLCEKSGQTYRIDKLVKLLDNLQFDQ